MMIRVKVFLPMGLSSRATDPQGWMTLPENARLKDLVHQIGMPGWIAKAFQVRLNGLSQPMDTPLQDGDTVSFFSLLQGG